MNIEIIHSRHPLDDTQQIALVYVDGKLDEPSAKWIAHAARSGGRGGNFASGGTLINMATEIARLYEDLADLGKTWYKATEVDLEHLRDTYLHRLAGIKKYNFKEITNNAMRIKLWYWFNFYTFQKQNGEVFAFAPTFKNPAAFNKWREKTSYLSHLSKRANPKKSEENEKISAKDWTLMVAPSAKKKTYHALSKDEFLHFRKRLKEIDVVYEQIAVFLVETGLRLTPALEVADKTFEYHFRHLNSGREHITVPFTNKGNKFRNVNTEFKLPIRCIQAIQDNYRANGSIYRKRKRLNDQLIKKGHTQIGKNSFWFKQSGYAILDQDIQKAFRDASKAMGRKGRDIITPHWMRHTFATWIVMEHIERIFGGEMNNTGVVPERDIMELLAKSLHHISIETTRIYIATAMDMLGLGSHSGAAPMTQRAFLKDKGAQEIVKEEAKAEFGHKFNESKFNLLDYAMSRGKVVDDD